MITAGRNHDSLKTFSLRHKMNIVPVNANDERALIHYKDGKLRKEEFYYGSSFLSQSARFLALGNNVSSVEIIDSRGTHRRISFP